MMYSFIGIFEGKTTGTGFVIPNTIRNQTIILILKITIDPAMRIMFMKNTEPAIIAVVDVLRETASRVVAVQSKCYQILKLMPMFLL
jgi:hypothetical protein